MLLQLFWPVWRRLRTRGLKLKGKLKAADAIIAAQAEHPEFDLNHKKMVLYEQSNTDIQVAVSELAKVVQAGMSALLGNIPGILSSIGSTTISFGHESTAHCVSTNHWSVFA